MKIVATIEARMSSSRLPGKVMLPLGEGCVLDVLVDRLGRSRYVEEVVLATTADPSDDALARHGEARGLSVFRGSVDDVMGRVLGAARSVGADLICETLGDSPLLDPVLLDHAVTRHLLTGADYTANIIPTRTFPVGMTVQVFSTEVLASAYAATDDPVDRAHVSYYIYQHPEEFVLQGIPVPDAFRSDDLRLCIDTREDYEAVSRIYEALDFGRRNPGAWELIEWLRAHPDVVAMTRDVRLKQPEEG